MLINRVHFNQLFRCTKSIHLTMEIVLKAAVKSTDEKKTWHHRLTGIATEN